MQARPDEIDPPPPEEWSSGSRIDQQRLQEYFPSARISKHWFGNGYRIEVYGVTMHFKEAKGFYRYGYENQNITPPPDLYRAMVLFLRDVVGWTSIKPSHTDAGEYMLWAVAARNAGVEMDPTGMEVSIPAMPEGNSHGSAGIAKLRDLKAAGLIVANGQTFRPGETPLRFGEFIENGYSHYLRYGGPSSVLVVGPPRKGKFVTVAATMVAEAIGKRSLVILDPKGEHLAVSGTNSAAHSKRIVLCPYKEGLPAELQHFADETDSYNPMAMLDPQSESFVMDCDALAEILIAADASGETKRDGGFFTEGAQAAVSGIIMHLLTFQDFPEQVKNLAFVAYVVCNGSQIFEFAEQAMENGTDYVRERLSTFGAPDARDMKGGINDILREMRRQLKWMSNPSMARVLGPQKKRWRFDDLKRGEKPSTVYVVLPSKYLDNSRRFFRLLLASAVKEFQSSPRGKWPVTCIADEFALLGRLSMFETVFAECAGHGFNMVPIIQDPGQMIATYGKQGWRNLLSACEVQIFLPPREAETADMISQMSGRKTITTLNVSQSGLRGNTDSDKDRDGLSFSEMGQNVLDAHDIKFLRKDQMVVFAPGLVKDVILANRRFYREYPEIAALCDPNPYEQEGR